MSYSLISECATCVKENQCTDRHFLDGAISGIHSMWPAKKGHLGAGTIVLNCNQHTSAVKEEAEKTT